MERRWHVARALGLINALLIAIVLSGCTRPPPEQALRQTIVELEAAVEARDAAALKDALAEDFIGPGGMDRQQAARLAQGMFFRHKDVGARLGPLELDVEQAQARVSFTAVLTGGAGLLPDSGQVYDVDTHWRLADGQWQLVRANWTPRM